MHVVEKASHPLPCKGIDQAQVVEVHGLLPLGRRVETTDARHSAGADEGSRPAPLDPMHPHSALELHGDLVVAGEKHLVNPIARTDGRETAPCLDCHVLALVGCHRVSSIRCQECRNVRGRAEEGGLLAVPGLRGPGVGRGHD